MPPTVNHYWARARNGAVYLTAKAKKFKTDVAWCVASQKPKRHTNGERLAMKVTLNFATKAKNDIDNRLKGLLDALTKAGVYDDDSQIDLLVVRRGEIVKGGQCVVEIGKADELGGIGEIITFLENFNAWRRGADIPMPEPKDIGQALDKAIEILKNYEQI